MSVNATPQIELQASFDAGLEEIERLDAALESYFQSAFYVQPSLTRSLVSFQANKNRPVYRWYKYKEGFSASLVEYFFRKYQIAHGKILDPFAGSGTALFTASAIGLDADGIELLPIGQQIISTKRLLENEFTTADFNALERWARTPVWRDSQERIPLNELRITAGAYPDSTKEQIENYLAAMRRENERVQAVLFFALLCIVEELVFRFLLTRGDTLGGSMRNIGGILAQRKLTRALLSTLKISGTRYSWQDAKSRNWFESDDDLDIELSLRGLYWKNGRKHRTLIYNLTVPLVKNNVDMCLFDAAPDNLDAAEANTYVALGELKGGIDPAGADEHWKTAKTALDRIRRSFARAKQNPHTFFIGAAIEKKMANEIWDELQQGVLSNAANLNDENQVASISHWLCNL